jgi:hypothetical protein
MKNVFLQEATVAITAKECAVHHSKKMPGTLDADEDLCSEKDVKRDISFFL